MALDFKSPPESICILRLSAIGDVCQAIPTVLAIQKHWPQTKITWIIGTVEHLLLKGMPGIEFIPFNKNKSIPSFFELKKKLSGRKFDVLLHMQTSLRSNLIATAIPATHRLGFDKSRAKELHSLVINHPVKVPPAQHQVDDFFAFALELGVPDGTKNWLISIPDEALEFARSHLPSEKKIVAINAASSPSKRVHRNWSTENFVHVIDQLGEQNLQTVLVSGPSEYEKDIAKRIYESVKHKPIDLSGKTNLKQFPAVIQQVDLLLSSDSGPCHVATAVGTPVIALHAATNPYQTGPYNDLDKTINVYPQCILDEYKKPLEELDWGIRAHGRNIMDQISVNEVMKMIGRVLKNTHRPQVSSPPAAIEIQM